MTSPQAPIGSGFGASTTAREVLGAHRLDGGVAIVTGGYSGLGLETTRVLAAAGATVIVPARTRDKGEAALAAAGLTGAQVDIEVETLELGDPASIDALAARFLASGRPLHMLINSAGIMACPLARDARGFESQLAVNHLGHFQLTARLWPALVRAGGARVISVSSRGHRRAGVDFDDPHFERRPYDKWVAYGQSKSANVLFARALDARGEADRVRAFSLHPGAILTNLVRHMADSELQAIGARDEHGNVPAARAHEYKTVEQGAATQVWCATSPQLAGMGGVYCEDVEIAQPVSADATSDFGVRPWAIDPALAERLWTASEAWTGVRLGA